MICVNKSVSDIGRFETFYKTRMNAQKISHKRTALGSVANLRHFRSTNQFCESTINNQNVTFMKRITKDATKKEVKLATLITAAADSSQTSYNRGCLYTFPSEKFQFVTFQRRVRKCCPQLFIPTRRTR